MSARWTRCSNTKGAAYAAPFFAVPSPCFLSPARLQPNCTCASKAVDVVTFNIPDLRHRNMRAQRCAKQLAMIADAQMQEFMDDHVLLKNIRLAEKVGGERDPTSRRAGRPLPPHFLDTDLLRCDAKRRRPAANSRLEGIGVAHDGAHRLRTKSKDTVADLDHPPTGHDLEEHLVQLRFELPEFVRASAEVREPRERALTISRARSSEVTALTRRVRGPEGFVFPTRASAFFRSRRRDGSLTERLLLEEPVRAARQNSSAWA